MEHKAFKFNFKEFERELEQRLLHALRSKNSSGLVDFINQSPSAFSDPYEGRTLSAGWMVRLENPADVHEVGDYALTRFYSPITDAGIGCHFIDVDDSLSATQRRAVLGTAIGPADNPFDPGKMGSYFQSPDDVCDARLIVAGILDDRVAGFANLLDECVASGSGLYVTF